MFGSSCLYLPLFIARLMSYLRCFPYDVRFVLSLPPVVHSKADVLFALFSYDVRFVLSLPPVVYSKTYVLFTLFVFVCMYWCLVHIVLCFVFLRLIYHMLPVSPACPFCITPSVFSNVYLQIFAALMLINLSFLGPCRHLY
jgi:hypothetical protein